jgi:hypothetical protein
VVDWEWDEVLIAMLGNETSITVTVAVLLVELQGLEHSNSSKHKHKYYRPSSSNFQRPVALQQRLFHRSSLIQPPPLLLLPPRHSELDQVQIPSLLPLGEKSKTPLSVLNLPIPKISSTMMMTTKVYTIITISEVIVVAEQKERIGTNLGSLSIRLCRSLDGRIRA